jgi:uncharacterized protein YraI
MKRIWFKFPFWISLTVGGLFTLSILQGTLAGAQQLTPGPTDVFITVTYTEQINVRSGPSTVLYDIIGNMQPGETASALGVSPGRDWVKIVFPSGPGGTGWVHTSLISVSSGDLQVLEPPPTSTPLITPTIDPTLMAAFIREPTSTRLPTFTPPPPLTVPAFTDAPNVTQAPDFPLGAIALALGIPGLAGFILSAFFRRR